VYRPNLSAYSSTEPSSTLDQWVPAGYIFSPSALYEGLNIAVTRLLRPLWNKPAVVVTEGRKVRRGSTTLISPAKVELLLEDLVVDQLRATLVSMKNIIRRVFSKAVRNVPLPQSSSSSATDGMDVDQDQYLLTTALEFQRMGQVDPNSTGLGPSMLINLRSSLKREKSTRFFGLSLAPHSS
jgi:hypothetical protein